MYAHVKVQIFLLLAFSFFRNGDGLGLPADKHFPDLLLTNLAFGSCNRHTLNQSAWTSIINYQPQIWIWLGDVVYTDRQYFPSFWASSPIELVQTIYAAQKSSFPYSTLAKTVPIVGVWDDHDFGKNDGGQEHPLRNQTKQIFLDFVDEPSESVRFKREGLYGSYTFGPPGKKVAVILLDTRYFKQGSHGEGDILGEEQWSWLAKTLNNSDAQVHLIGSGTQVLPSDKLLIEKWGCHPNSRERLFKTIRDSNAKGVILISGDVHHGEILSQNCQDLHYPLYEITSSGITHSCNLQLSFISSSLCDLLLSTVIKSQYQIDFYSRRNFGTIEINWDLGEISLQIRDTEGNIKIKKDLSLKMLEASWEGSNLQVEDCHHRVYFWYRWPKASWIYFVLYMFFGFVVIVVGIVLWYLRTANRRLKVE